MQHSRYPYNFIRSCMIAVRHSKEMAVKSERFIAESAYMNCYRACFASGILRMAAPFGKPRYLTRKRSLPNRICPLSEIENPISSERGPRLFLTGRPTHFDAIDLVRLSQTEVKG